MLTCCFETALAFTLFHCCSLHIQAVTPHGGPCQTHDYPRGCGLIYAVAGEGRGANIVLEIIWANDYCVIAAKQSDRWRTLRCMCSLLGILAGGLLTVCNKVQGIGAQPLLACGPMHCSSRCSKVLSVHLHAIWLPPGAPKDGQGYVKRPRTQARRPL